jgi:hypothetical protein
MSDSSFTIGDFAEGLIASELGKVQEDPSYVSEAISTQQASPNVPDVRTVQVPNNFMKEILGESTEPSSEVLEQPRKTLLNEEDVVLFQKLHSLVKELDSVLSEMTMTGHLGTAQCGPGNKSKAMKRGEDGYIPVTKSVKAAKSFLQKLNKKTGVKREVDDTRDPGENEPGIADDPAKPAYKKAKPSSRRKK